MVWSVCQKRACEVPRELILSQEPSQRDEGGRRTRPICSGPSMQQAAAQRAL